MPVDERVTPPARGLHDGPVSNTLGDPTTPPPPPPVRAATRSRGPGWRDPRLWIGVVLVAASVVGGSRLLSAADDTVAVWASVEPHGAGDRLAAEDLTPVRVRFTDDATLTGYFAVDATLPRDLVLIRGVDAGDLVPRGAVGSAEQSDLVELPLAVDPELVPGSVGAGAVVDVYVVARTVDPDAATTPGQPALSAVTVLDAPSPADSFGTASGRRQLVLAVPDEIASTFFALLGSTPDPVVTVVRRS